MACYIRRIWSQLLTRSAHWYNGSIKRSCATEFFPCDKQTWTQITGEKHSFYYCKYHETFKELYQFNAGDCLLFAVYMNRPRTSHHYYKQNPTRNYVPHKANRKNNLISIQSQTKICALISAGPIQFVNQVFTSLPVTSTTHSLVE